MHKFFWQLINHIKATIKNVIVAFTFALILLGITYLILQKPIKKTNELIQLISVNSTKKVLKNVTLDLEKHKLTSYPSYKSNYARLKIPTININLPVYYGDEFGILNQGIGHTPGTYFPGELGSILYMAHNSENMLKHLPEAQLGSEIIIETTYGTFTYKISETKIIKETDWKEIPIQNKEELLMLYTCYPTNSIVYTQYRYIVYAKRV